MWHFQQVNMTLFDVPHNSSSCQFRASILLEMYCDLNYCYEWTFWSFNAQIMSTVDSDHVHSSHIITVDISPSGDPPVNLPSMGVMFLTAKYWLFTFLWQKRMLCHLTALFCLMEMLLTLSVTMHSFLDSTEQFRMYTCRWASRRWFFLSYSFIFTMVTFII